MATGDPRAALAAAAAARGESLAALSRLLGRNAAYLQQFVARGSPRRLDERDRRLLATYLAIDEATLGARPAVPAPVPIAWIDAAASAGPGALVENEGAIGAIGFDPALLRALGVRPADASLIRASGASMAPGIADGDLLLVDRARRPTRQGGVFVLRLDGTLLVKRLGLAGGQVTIASDNPDAAPIAPRTPAEVDVIGAVVWLSRAVR